jgi:outer membrane protein TolC
MLIEKFKIGSRHCQEVSNEKKTGRRYRGVMKFLLESAICLIAGTAILVVFPVIHAGAVEDHDNRDFLGDYALTREQVNLPRIDLASLEEELESAPEILIAVAELEEKRNLLVREQARNGLQFQVNSGVGNFSEVNSSEDSRDYDEGHVALRLRYPILGTMEEQRIGNLKAEARTWESRERLELARRRGLAALRNNYITYWACQEQIEQTQAFLDAEDDVSAALRRRKISGYLLDSDLQEFLSVFEVVRRNAARLRATQVRALRSMRLLTRPSLAHFKAVAPRFFVSQTELESLRSEVLDDYPEIVLYRGLVDEQLGILELTRWGDVEGHVDLGGFVNRESPPDNNGYGASLGVTVAFPAFFSKSNSAAKQAALAALRKAQYALEARSNEILGTAEDAWYRLHAERKNILFARQRVIAALERLRVDVMRLEEIPGDTIETLEKNRYQYYLAAADYVEAKALLFRQKVRLCQFLEESPASAARLTPGTEGEKPDSVIHKDYLRPLWCDKVPRELYQPKSDVPVVAVHSWEPDSGVFSVYVWESRELLKLARESSRFWDDLKANSFNRLLISFDQSQIEALNSSPMRLELQAFLEEARRRGIAVNLLLGEPSWILPEFRQDLLNLVQELSAFEFSGLHLDLEPNQLNSEIYSESYLLGQLLATVQSVRQVSPWPLGLSIHPRYLDEKQTNICLGCALSQLALDEVALMIYSSKPETVANRFNKVAAAYPDLSLSLAQSVEPILTGKESYSGFTRGAFFNAMARLQNLIGNEKPAAVIIQSWRDFERMKPENKDGLP